MGEPGTRRLCPDSRPARTQLNFWSENRGLIKIGGANNPPDTMPAWIVIENLELRAAHTPNNYTETNDITFQYNWFGPLKVGAGGNNLKDRSAGCVVRYNWIEGGNRQLDLVDSDFPELYDDPDYRNTFVYGNVLLERDGDGNSQIAHYGGDSGTLSHYRQGTLWFFQNTVVSRRSGNTTLFRLSSSAEAADARNNIVSVTATGNRLGMLDQTGTLTIAQNWFKTGWVNSHSGAASVINNGQITGSDPGFHDAFDNFELASTSAAIDQGIPAAPATLPEHAIVCQYMKHQGSRTRPISGPIDLGAYEFSLPSAVPPAETQSPARLLAWHTPSPGPFAFELSEAPPTASPVEIFDVLGRRVARVEKGEADGRWTWRPTVDLSPGVYVARIGALTTRVVLVR